MLPSGTSISYVHVNKDDKTKEFWARSDSKDKEDQTGGTWLDKVFKLVDPERGVCVLLGEQFEYRPIQREVERMLALAVQADANGGRLRPLGTR